MLKLSAWLSIAVGAGLSAGQLIRNLDNWARWPTWGIDVTAGLIMIVAGLLALRKQTTRLLPVGWAFACGLYVSSLIGHLTVLSRTSGARHAVELQTVVIVTALLAISLVGLAMVLLTRQAQD